jgi:fructose-specific component phosphotransferase system IIB-like protein
VVYVKKVEKSLTHPDNSLQSAAAEALVYRNKMVF